ncbi:hypothetical protein B0H15DRAFT_973069 [Mycena belliarum]|uniref:F-box domain-containing protein n=1 Tax=Mycena belliarum TaxID=1033014 RepID=A0AAD6XW85_9AGAR|nr:hypothetical protein B0H15DRAFT_973069 [Mycena belliae]
MSGSLLELDDDVLILLFDLLDVPDIFAIRQACKRMQRISELRIVWTNACKHQIIQQHYPFPDISLADLPGPEIERRTRHAYRLASWWLSPEPPQPGLFSEFDATNGTPLLDLRFVPGHDGLWLLAVSKGIWSIISIWELAHKGATPVKKFEWSRRDCLLKDFVLNGDPASEGVLAISVVQNGATRVNILSLQQDEGFRRVAQIDSAWMPVYLHGELLVLCDSTHSTLVVNWRTTASAILYRSETREGSTGIEVNNPCFQIVVTSTAMLVVRAHSMVLFRKPPLSAGTPLVYTQLAEHRYGWVDGIAVSTIVESRSAATTSAPPLTILVRPEPDDPWASEANSLHLYVLHPADSPDSPVPYVFPPTHTVRVPSVHGALQWSALRFGPRGTAVWVEPQDRSAAGLYAGRDDAHAPVAWQDEGLVCAVFPGPLFPYGAAAEPDGSTPLLVRSRALCTNALNNWTTVDYDEVHGLIAIGSTRGQITVLSLVPLHA